jgi:hypothetical protein
MKNISKRFIWHKNWITIFMKKIFRVLLLVLVNCVLSSNTNFKNNEKSSMRSINNSAFTYGEKLSYKISYGLIDAGYAQLEVKKSKTKIQNKSVYHIVGIGTSSKTFDWFFKIRDRYESYIDSSALVPLLFKRNINEGGYKMNQNYEFNHQKHTVKTSKGDIQTKKYIQDMLSCFYYARTLRLNKLKKGDVLAFNAFVDGETYPLKVKFLGKEVVKIKAGKFKALKFCPIVQTGRIFKHNESLSVWISDDYNKVPLLVKAKILFGSLRMEMIKMEGELNPSGVIR